MWLSLPTLVAVASCAIRIGYALPSATIPAAASSTAAASSSFDSASTLSIPAVIPARHVAALPALVVDAAEEKEFVNARDPDLIDAALDERMKRFDSSSMAMKKFDQDDASYGSLYQKNAVDRSAVLVAKLCVLREAIIRLQLDVELKRLEAVAMPSSVQLAAILSHKRQIGESNIIISDHTLSMNFKNEAISLRELHMKRRLLTHLSSAATSQALLDMIKLDRQIEIAAVRHQESLETWQRVASFQARISSAEGSMSFVEDAEYLRRYSALPPVINHYNVNNELLAARIIVYGHAYDPSLSTKVLLETIYRCLRAASEYDEPDLR